MSTVTTVPGFAGEIVRPGDTAYDRHREVWNAIVDRRPAIITRCTSTDDVAAAVRFARDAGLEIAVKCGGHSVLGLSVPEAGLMVDLTPMNQVRVDRERRRAFVQGGALLGDLDRGAEHHGLATTAGNVSHTGVGGLTLGGGMGWLARRFGLACDNVETYAVVTAEGDSIRASATEHEDLYWGLRGGGGNFGIVTEFEFRLHPMTGRALAADLYFEPAEAATTLRAWRQLLAEAPREATFTADAMTAGDAPFLPSSLHGRPVVAVGYVWVGDLDEARAFLRTFRRIGQPVAENIEEMTYVELQSIADERHRHGVRRYSTGHYLTELGDAAIEAFVSRGVGVAVPGTDWSRVPNGGFQAYGGAIAEVDDESSAFSHRDALVEFGGATSWLDPAEDEQRITAARAYSAAMEPFASGVYVNTLADEGPRGVRRAYPREKFARLAALKRRYDPDNVFHLNQNIPPSGDDPAVGGPSATAGGR